MGWKRVVGKLMLVAAGTGCLVLMMFVLLPLLTQTPAPPQDLVSEEIARQVLTPLMAADEDVNEVASLENESEEEVTPVPSPLVGLRDNGEEVAVVFPAAADEQTQDETLDVPLGPLNEGRDEMPANLGAELPPVLSPEEVAAAMALMAGGGDENTGPAGMADAPPEPVIDLQESEPGPGSPQQVRSAQTDRWQPEVFVVRDSEGSRHVEVTLPPPSATREVQELLEALGYDPGPLDGIWGERTARAWRSYARDAAEFAARTQLEELQSESTAEPSAPVSPTPSGETVEPEGPGAGQAGDTRQPAGLPPEEAAQPVVVPGTLRGVMGYRMPLVSRQGVPDQVVSGVLIPAHTTFVILKPGHWELVGLEPEEVERLRDSAARRGSAVAASEADTQPVKRGWNLFGLFRKRSPRENSK